MTSQEARGANRLILKQEFSTVGSSQGYHSLGSRLRHSHNGITPQNEVKQLASLVLANEALSGMVPDHLRYANPTVIASYNNKRAMAKQVVTSKQKKTKSIWEITTK